MNNNITLNRVSAEAQLRNFHTNLARGPLIRRRDYNREGNSCLRFSFSHIPPEFFKRPEYLVLIAEDIARDLMPQWLEGLLIPLNDKGTEAAHPALIARFAASIDAFPSLSPASWRRVQLHLLSHILSLAKSHCIYATKTALHSTLRASIAQELGLTTPLPLSPRIDSFDACSLFILAVKRASEAFSSPLTAHETATAIIKAVTAVTSEVRYFEGLSVATAASEAEWDRVGNVILSAIEDEIAATNHNAAPAN